MGKQPRGIQSIEVGGRLLDALVAHATPMSLKDLAGAAGMAPAQAHGYLASYRRCGMVEQDAATGRYQLGPFAMRLATARLRTVPELVAATQATIDLARELGIMATLAVWGPHGATVVHRQDGDEVLNVNIRVGTMFAMEATATGYLFAAFAPKARRAPIKDPAAAARIADARASGYAITREAPVPGVNALAAPILDADGDIAAAITLIGSVGRLSVATKDNPALDRLLEVSRGLSAAGRRMAAASAGGKGR
ncbi:DNA-binding IclR family transcriptional regulator [Amorphus suaedae]